MGTMTQTVTMVEQTWMTEQTWTLCFTQPLAKLQPPTFTQRALLINSERKYELNHNFATPATLGEHEVKIRNCAVGLNQIDYKSVDYNFCLPQLPWITGREMAGVVEEVGSSVHRLKPGQRVWTSTYYRDRRAGCFQEFVIVPEHTVTKMASNITFTEAACLGVCGLTAAMTLWKWFDIPLPYGTIFTPPDSPCEETQERPCLLVWGGSSVTGQFIIQLAKRGGLRVVSINSAITKDMVTNLGADHVIVRDRKQNADIVEETRALLGDQITMAVDLVGSKTAVAASQCLSRTKPARLAPVAFMLPTETPANVEIVNIQMKDFVLNQSSSVYSEQLSILVEEDEIRLPEIEILKGGLNAVKFGLERLKSGDMAGRKLVIDMQS